MHRSSLGAATTTPAFKLETLFSQKSTIWKNHMNLYLYLTHTHTRTFNSVSCRNKQNRLFLYSRGQLGRLHNSRLIGWKPGALATRSGKRRRQLFLRSVSAFTMRGGLQLAALSLSFGTRQRIAHELCSKHTKHRPIEGSPDTEEQNHRSRLLGELVLQNPPIQLQPAEMPPGGQTFSTLLHSCP